MIQDLRFALRTLHQSPGFTAVCILTLALGIGANTAIFSVVNAVLLRPLPFAEPERLVMLWEERMDGDEPRNHVSPANFLAWRDEARSFDGMAAFAEGRMVLAGDGGASESVTARFASPDVFRLLGARAVAGRLLQAADEREDGADVAVLSHGIWQRRFGGRDVVGETLLFDGEAHVVVGVLPRDFRFVEPAAEVWIPFRFGPESRTFGGRFLRVLGRLAPGVGVAAADGEMASIAAARAAAFPEIDANWTAHAVSLQSDLAGEARPALFVLLGAVGFLLLIACANVANLLAARASSRAREIAVRAALGATRARLSRQLLTESLLLGLLGGAAGLLLGVWLTRALVGLVPPDLPIPRLDEVTLDLRVLAFATGVSVLTGLAFGWLPALAATRANVQDALKEGGRAGTGRRTGAFRSALVVGELALALVLLAGAGLTARSFRELLQVEPGFSTEHVMAAELALPEGRYPEASKQLAFFEQLERQLAALPGVRAVGAISFLPLSGQRSATSIAIEGQPAPPAGEEPGGDMRAVTPGYFQAMGIPLKEGRGIAAADAAGRPNVAIVAEGLARRFWPGESAVGKRLTYSWDEEVPVEIVGVVGDVRHSGPATDPYMEIYLPVAQFPYSSMQVVVRSAGDPLALAAAVRTEVRRIDPDQPVAEIRSLDALMADALGGSRLSTFLFAGFAGLGLLLALVGTYGLTAHGVAQRTAEIGLRAALGARPGDLLRMVVGQAGRLAALGILLGLVGALLLTRLMSSLLFGVDPADPLTYVAVCGVLASTVLLASVLPARRAARIDPMRALRQE
ncbi:MAG: ABC transporter permease [Gemmatimonadota bacterium]